MLHLLLNSWRRSLVAVIGMSVFVATTGSAKETALQRHGKVVTEHFTSEVLRENRVGLELNRSITVYLPPGYDESTRSYPVVYYFHPLLSSNEKVFAEGNPVQPVLDRGISNGVIRDFILVAPNYSSPTLGSWFENSPVSGHWLDYTIKEVVPFIDAHFRTIRHRDSRALTGEFIGAYGALKLAMLHPDLFSVVYGLHPVATGSGLMPTADMVNWPRLHQAKAFSELWGDHYAPGFVAIAQGYLPNLNRPPFYCDFIVEMKDGQPKVMPENQIKLEAAFHLDELLRHHADNLRKLKAIAFDWGRYDSTQSHVFSNQAFTRKLDQLGIEHIGEEYNGGPYEKNWTKYGRVYAHVLPFLERNLVFE